MKIEYVSVEEFFQMLGLQPVKRQTEPKREIKYINFGSANTLINFEEIEYTPVFGDPNADGKVN